MGSRGRTSAAELSVISGGGIETVRRPEPLAELTAEETDVWHQVVNRLPADWFPAETLPMLAQYCRHTVASRRVAMLIERMQSDAEGFEIKDYDRLLKLQERESRCLASLATKMRISQQTTYDKSRKKGSVGAKKPWEG